MNSLSIVNEGVRSGPTLTVPSVPKLSPERRWKAANDISQGYAVTDSYGVILEANPFLAELLNVPYPYLIGKPLAAFVSLNERRTFRTRLNLVCSQPQELNWQLTFIPRHHLPLLTEVYTIAVRIDDKPLKLRWAIRDISWQKTLEENSRHERERLQTLSQRMVEMQEAERRNLARELHDEVGQLLTGLKLSLEYSGQQELVAQTKIPDAITIATQLMEQIHTLSLQLRPPMLDTLGLIPTLQWHFKRYTAQTHIQVYFQADLPGNRYSSQIELTVYRLVQEALTNIARHAKVQEAFVSICEQEEILHILIEDHGVGFNDDQVQKAYHSSGLTGMQERIDAVGGQLTLDSALGKGTQIQVTIPLG